jgi:hypothetical protein
MAPQFTPGAADDAMRDALALVRACLQGDRAAAATVAANAAWLPVTAVILAQVIADFAAAMGTEPGTALAGLAAWQQDAGLS